MPAVSRQTAAASNRRVPLLFDTTSRRGGTARVEDMRPLLALFPSKSHRRNRAMHVNAEQGTLRTVCRFMVWALKQSRFPTPEAVATHFGCSRATSYRWLNALADAQGIEPPWRAQKA